LKSAVDDFNNVQIDRENVKTLGIVGEIYIKYNTYGQHNIIDWLIKNRIEVVFPHLSEFFMQAFVNSKVSSKDFINRKSGFTFITKIAEAIASAYIEKFDNALKKFRFYRKNENINHLAKLASEILSLNNQYGEGWLIPAGIASFAQKNINNVICLQPFGCIANHIVGKGMETKIKSIYPEINLLYLDFDSGISRVNVLNRLHFLIQNIEEEFIQKS